MSHDPKSPSDAADFDDDPPDAFCEDCGEPLDSNDINVEAFETTGLILCHGCASDHFEAESLAEEP